MGKCIVCSKSAGPFYSLHKACYPVYESTNRCLQQAVADIASSTAGQEGIRQRVEACRPSSTFSQSLFETLITRAWQEQAARTVKSRSPDPGQANNLLGLASTFGLKEEAVDPHLFLRLSNIEHFTGIQQGRRPSRSFPDVRDEFGMDDEESLLWIFEGVRQVGQKRQVEPSRWALFQTILNNQFRKSRYREREMEVQAQGRLAITDQNIYYMSGQVPTKLGLADIYAITPLEDGVRIQPVYSGSRSSSYITGDGRFTYALLSYAQDQMRS